MVCHVDLSVEAIPPSSDIDQEAQLLWGRGEGLYKSCDVITFCVNKF